MLEEPVDGFRLSPPQRHLWLSQQEGGDAAYRAQCAVRIGGNLDRTRLGEAFDRVMERHEILRTTFQTVRGMELPLQVIAERGGVTVEDSRGPGLDAEQQAEGEERLLEAAQQVNFDLATGPLLKVTLSQSGPARHLMLVTLPTLCGDGATLTNLIHEVARSYSTEGRPEDGQPMQYADVAEWQNDLLEREDSAAGKEYWREKELVSAPALRLPFERPSAPPIFQLQSLVVPIASATGASIGAVAERYGCSEASFLLACWQILLWRLSGETAVVVGMGFDGRRFEQLKNALGLFAKYVPLRGDLDDGSSFHQVLTSVERARGEGEKWQDYFTWDGIEGSPTETGSRRPFFPFCFDYENSAATYPAGEVAFSIRSRFVCLDRFKIRLACTRRDSTLSAQFHYDAALFERDDVERLGAQFAKLLESAVERPESTAGELSILGDAERHRVVVAFNESGRLESPGRCIHQLFEDQAERTPDQIAVVFEDERLTYAELNARANRLAHRLTSLGVGPGSAVGLFVERSVEMVVGLLGILKAGGGYVPLDPALPKERLAFMVEDVGASVLLTETPLAHRLPSSLVHVLTLDGDSLASGPSRGNPITEASSGDVAYVIFTSGSTGMPKGVAVEHRQLVNYTNGVLERLALPPGASFATVSTFAADLGNTAIFPSLCTGGTLHVVSRDRASDPDALADYFEAHPVDCLKIAPSHLAALLAGSRPGAILPRRCLVLGGEALGWDLIEKLQALSPDCILLNHYGPTEATVGVTTYRVERSPTAHRTRTVPVGRPIANMEVYLLDSHQQPVPIWVPGELHIGGDGLARGYLNRPRLTAEKFIPHPFRDGGARLYKTGDLARYLPDGNIELLGRTDHQVKVHGFRVELGEIEAVLKQHPAVRESLVLLREDEPGDKRLVAYVVSNPKPWPGATELRSFLQDKVPGYMVPSSLVMLERLPLTPNGKLDRSALPVPDQPGPEREKEFVAASTPAEQVLARIWADVLRLEQVSVHDNFFELGGDSILGIQIIARATQAGLLLSPRQLFERQTVAELAEVAGTPPVSRGSQGAVTGPVPLSPIQHWFFEQDLPERHHYNQAVLLKARRKLDPALLEQVIERLVQHHDALRLRYLPEGPHWRQINAGMEQNPLFSRVDLSAIPEADQNRAIESAAAQLQASLNLTAGPLVRVAFFDLGPEKPSRLLIVIHHLAVDGISWRILLDDLQTAYEQLWVGQDLQLSPKTTSFKEWAEGLTEHAPSALLRQELPYWLAEPRSRVSALPLDFPGGTNSVASGQSLSVSLNAEETKALLQEVPTAYRTQINDALLTALAEAFAGWTGARSLLIDLEGHGREQIAGEVDVSRTVGWFTARFPVLLELPGSSERASALNSIKEQLRGIPRRGIGYGILRYLTRDSEVAEKLRAMPQPEVSFNYLGQLDQMLPQESVFSLASESAGPMRSSRGTRRYLLAVDGSILRGRLRFSWRYSENLHRRATIARLAKAFVDQLRALIADCSSPDAPRAARASGSRDAKQPQADRARPPAGDQPGTLLEEAFEPPLAHVIPRRQGHGPAPLSFAQERLWFLDQLQPGSAVYNMAPAFRLTGLLDTAALKRSLEEIVRRHEGLRTTFEAVEGRPVQVIHPAGSLPLPVVDLGHLPESEREGEAKRQAAAEAEGSFDLSRGPLFRAKLLRLDDQEHLLLLTMHHIVSDNWSRGILNRELAALYEAFSVGKPSPLPDLPVQYADYAVWQREWLRGERLESQLSYWKRRLEGAPPVVDLLTDLPRPPVQSYRGATDSLLLPTGLTRDVRRLARQERVTLFILLLAAFQTLLSRYTGQEEIVVGSATTNRNSTETEGLIGFFLNSLVLRTDLSGNPTFRELLGRVREVALGAYANQDIPFEKLLEELQPERDLSRTPLFQVFMNMLNVPTVEMRLPGLTIEPIGPREDVASRFDITLYAKDTEAGLRLKLVYNADLFEAATTTRMLTHLRTLLESVTADPDQRLWRLRLMSESEKLSLSRRRNRVRPSEPLVEFRREEIEQSIPARFEQQVLRYGSRLAIKTARHEWTYAMLDEAANGVARRIRGPAGSTSERVALLVEHDAPMLAALLGSLKAGKTYVPLDPVYPAERLAFMLRDSEAGCILTNNRNSTRARVLAEAAGLPVVNLDEPGHTEDSSSAPQRIAPDSLAYILYTSGSTGRPKGVTQTHRNVLHFTRVYTNALHLGPEDRLTLLSSYSFDAAVMDIFGALLNGATLYPVDVAEEGLLGLADTLSRERITVLHAVPSVYRSFVETLQGSEDFGGLRLVVLGGEEVYRTDLDSFRKHFPPGSLFVNGLGPTESTVSLQYFLDRETRVTRHNVPVGYPVEETEILLLDREGAPTELYGEIGIRSAFVSPGYWRRPDLTPIAFLNDPEGGGRRIYRTGDVGRLLPEGEIQFLGRKDAQIKIRGFRVEPGEIEATLRQHPGVREAAVVARENSRGERSLVAYVVLVPDLASAPGALRNFLAEKLPGYMVPASFVTLERLPLLPTGKLNRAALPAPDPSSAAAEKAFAPPRTPIEELLAEVWTELLAVERVSLHDNFFELGGHSLLATRAIARLRNALQIELPLRIIFDSPTLADLAVAIAQKQAEREDPEDISRLLAEIRGETPAPATVPPGGSQAPS